MALDRLEAMRAFCRIVEVGSFSNAAESLSVAKTTLSGQVQTLEAMLGIKLLHRTTRKVSPTTEGAAYYTRARAIIDDVDELESAISRSQNEIRGWIRIEMPSPVGLLLVLPALNNFSEKYPDIKLDIGCSERVLDLRHDGVDCAIRGGGISDDDLVCRQIGLMRFCFCASPAYLQNSPVIRTASDLPHHKHLGFKFPGTGRRYTPTLYRGDESFTLDQPPSMYLSSGSATAVAALAGLGVAFLPTAEAEPHFKSGALIELLPDWQLPSMPLSVVYPFTRHLPSRVRAFIDWITALMDDNPLWRLSE